MKYRVILTKNGEYVKTFYGYKTKAACFNKFYKMLEENKKIMFPKRYVNSYGIKPVKYRLCVSKVSEEGDIPGTYRDEFGKAHKEKPLGDWTILLSEKYNLEETFQIFGYTTKKVRSRPTIKEIVKILLKNSNDKKNIKQIIVVHNKLVIHNENEFDMIICKCIDDAQRLHHTLYKSTEKLKIKNLVFMGTAIDFNISVMYKIIQEKTGWPMKKVMRAKTYDC